MKSWLLAMGAAISLAACDGGSLGGPPPAGPAGAAQVLAELETTGIISSSVREEGDSILQVVAQVRDSLEQALRSDDLGFWWSGYLQTALDRLSDYHQRGLLDSTRTGNLLDQIAVTLEFVRGTVERNGEQYYPQRTPHLTWVFYGGTGIYFQPVTTVERLAGLPLPDAAAPLDSLIAAGAAMWSQAVWRDGSRGRYPVWEYDFSYRTNFLDLRAPWRSGMAQGEALKLYCELNRRTGDLVWLNHAADVFNSMMTPWSQGGMLSPDTTHGYWWDEYDPAAIVWNGSIVALIGVGLYAEASGEAEALHAWQRGLEAARYWTPFIDDGVWTRYSLLVGHVNVPYHAWHIQLADALFELSDDPLWLEFADRWRSYTPPALATTGAVGPNEVAGLVPDMP